MSEMPMGDRNIVTQETLEYNRGHGVIGAYSFHTPIDEEFIGQSGFQFVTMRIGDHAHIVVYSGRIAKSRDGARVMQGRAGDLVLRWNEWLILRVVLSLSPVTHIFEVENPTPSQIKNERNW